MRVRSVYLQVELVAGGTHSVRQIFFLYGLGIGFHRLDRFGLHQFQERIIKEFHAEFLAGLNDRRDLVDPGLSN